jgi:hypothetical protein
VFNRGGVLKNSVMTGATAAAEKLWCRYMRRALGSAPATIATASFKDAGLFSPPRTRIGTFSFQEIVRDRQKCSPERIKIRDGWRIRVGRCLDGRLLFVAAELTLWMADLELSALTIRKLRARQSSSIAASKTYSALAAKQTC